MPYLQEVLNGANFTQGKKKTDVVTRKVFDHVGLFVSGRLRQTGGNPSEATASFQGLVGLGDYRNMRYAGNMGGDFS
jgi:hypothetical protein